MDIKSMEEKEKQVRAQLCCEKCNEDSGKEQKKERRPSPRYDLSIDFEW